MDNNKLIFDIQRFTDAATTYYVGKSGETVTYAKVLTSAPADANSDAFNSAGAITGITVGDGSLMFGASAGNISTANTYKIVVCEYDSENSKWNMTETAVTPALAAAYNGTVTVAAAGQTLPTGDYSAATVDVSGLTTGTVNLSTLTNLGDGKITVGTVTATTNGASTIDVTAGAKITAAAAKFASNAAISSSFDYSNSGGKVTITAKGDLAYADVSSLSPTTLEMGTHALTLAASQDLTSVTINGTGNIKMPSSSLYTTKASGSNNVDMTVTIGTTIVKIPRANVSRIKDNSGNAISGVSQYYEYTNTANAPAGGDVAEGDTGDIAEASSDEGEEEGGGATTPTVTIKLIETVSGTLTIGEEDSEDGGDSNVPDGTVADDFSADIVEAEPDPVTAADLASVLPSGSYILDANGKVTAITLNGTTAIKISLGAADGNITITNNSTGSSTITLGDDYTGKMTLDAASTGTSLSINSPDASVSNTSVDANGNITVTYSNGTTITIPSSAVGNVKDSNGDATNAFTSNFLYDSTKNKITLTSTATSVEPGDESGNYATTVTTIDATLCTGGDSNALALTLGAAVTSVELNTAASINNTVTLASGSTVDVNITGTNAGDTIYTNGRTAVRSTSYNGNKLTVTFGTGSAAAGSITIDAAAGGGVNLSTVANGIKLYSGTSSSSEGNAVTGVSTLYSYDGDTKTATFYQTKTNDPISLADANLPSELKILDLSKVTGEVTLGDLSSYTSLEEIKVGSGGFESTTGGTDFNSAKTVINLGNYNLDKSEYDSDNKKITLTYNSNKTITLIGSSDLTGFKYNDKENTGAAVELSTMYKYEKSGNNTKTIDFYGVTQPNVDTQYPSGVTSFTNVGYASSPTAATLKVPDDAASAVTVSLSNVPNASDKAGTLIMNDSKKETVTFTGGYWTLSGMKNSDTVTIDNTVFNASDGATKVTSIKTEEEEDGSTNTKITITKNDATGTLIVPTTMLGKVTATLPTEFKNAISSQYYYDSINNANGVLTVIAPTDGSSEVTITTDNLPQTLQKIVMPATAEDAGTLKKVTISGNIPNTVQEISYGAIEELVISNGGTNPAMKVTGVAGSLTWNNYVYNATTPANSQLVTVKYAGGAATLKSSTNTSKGYTVVALVGGKDVTMNINGSSKPEAVLVAPDGNGSTASASDAFIGISRAYDYDSTAKSVTILTNDQITNSGAANTFKVPIGPNLATEVSVASTNNSAIYFDASKQTDTSTANTTAIKLTAGTKGGTIIGTGGNDTVDASASTSGVSVVGGGGTDKITLGTGGGTVQGGADADNIDAGLSSNGLVYIDGGADASTADNVTIGAKGGYVTASGGDNIYAYGVGSSATLNITTEGAQANNVTLGAGKSFVTVKTTASDTFVFNGGTDSFTSLASSKIPNIKAGSSAYEEVASTTNNTSTGIITVSLTGGGSIAMPNAYSYKKFDGSTLVENISRYYNYSASNNKITLVQGDKNISTANGVTLVATDTHVADDTTNNSGTYSTSVTMIDATNVTGANVDIVTNNLGDAKVTLGSSEQNVTLGALGGYVKAGSGNNKITYGGGSATVEGTNAVGGGTDKIVIGKKGANERALYKTTNNNGTITLDFNNGETIVIPTLSAGSVYASNGSTKVNNISYKYDYDSNTHSIELVGNTAMTLTADDYAASTDVTKIYAENYNSSKAVNIQLQSPETNKGMAVTLGAMGGVVTTSLGSDTVIAGDGKITLYSGGGANSNDNVKLGSKGGVIHFDANGGTGKNTLDASEATGAVEVYAAASATDGADKVTIGSGAATVDLGAGADELIQIGTGNIIVDLGDGDDNATINGAATIAGGKGKNAITLGDTASNVKITSTGSDTITFNVYGGYVNGEGAAGMTVDGSLAQNGAITVISGAAASGGKADNITLGSAGGYVQLGTKGTNDKVVYNGGAATITGFNASVASAGDSDTIRVGTLDNYEIIKTETLAGATADETRLKVTFGDPNSSSSSKDVLVITNDTKVHKKTGTDTYAEISKYFTYTATADAKSIKLLGNVEYGSSVIGATTGASIATPDDISLIDATSAPASAEIKILAQSNINSTIKAGAKTNITLDSTNETNDVIILSASTTAVTITGFGKGDDILQVPNGYKVLKTADSSNDLLVTLQSGNDANTRRVVTFINGATLAAGVADTAHGFLEKITLQDASGNNIPSDDSDSNGISGYYSYDSSTAAITLLSGLTDTTITSDMYPSTVKKIDLNNSTGKINFVSNDNTNTIIAGTKGGTVVGGSGVNTFIIKSPTTTEAVTIKGYESGDKVVYSGTYVISDTSIDDSTGNITIHEKTAGSSKPVVIEGGANTDLIVNYLDNNTEKTLPEVSRYFSYAASFDENSAVTDATITAVSDFDGTLGGSATGATTYPTQTTVINASKTTNPITINMQDKVKEVELNTNGDAAKIIYNAATDATITAGTTANDGSFTPGTAYNSENTIQLASAGITLTQTAWGEGDATDTLVITLSTGKTLSIDNVHNKQLTFLDSSGKQVAGVSGYYTYSDVAAAKTITFNEIASNSTVELGTINASSYPSDVKVINASAVAKEVEIVGNAQDNTIKAGTNATVSGGTGNDEFIYKGGIVTVGDFSATTGNSDTIKLAAGFTTDITKTEYEGSNLVIYFGSNNANILTIVGAKGKKLNFQDSSGNAIKTVSGFFAYDSTWTETGVTGAVPKITYNDAATSISKDDYPSTGVKAIDVSAITKGMSIDISGAITHVTGTAQADTFTFYGGANAAISGFTSADKLIFNAGGTLTQTAISSDGEDLVITVNSKTLTLKGVADPDSWVATVSATYNNGTKVEGISGYYSYNPSATLKNSMGTGKSITLNNSFTGTLPANLYPSDVKEIYVNGFGSSEDPENANPLNIVGSTAANIIYLGTGGSTADGGAGNDTLYGAADATLGDSIKGGAGNDLITVSGGDNILIGDAGRDTLYGGAGNDIIDGGADNDLIFAGTGGGGNSLMGNAGNDTLVAGSGADTLTGGAGNDVFVFTGGNADSTTEIVITDYNTGTNSIKLAGKLTTVTASTYTTNGASVGSSTVDGKDVILNITDGTNALGKIRVVNAKDKELTIYSSTAVTGTAKALDELNGYATTPETRIYGYYNADTVSTAVAPAAAGDTRISLNADFEGTLSTTTYASTVTIIDATSNTNDITIIGNAKHNKIIGGEGSDSIDGGVGNDTIYAYLKPSTYGADTDNKGDDTIKGGAGNDSIHGSALGNNVIYGDTESDSIYGYAGNNSIYGGAGADGITVTSGDNLIYGENENDTIIAGTDGNNTLDGGNGDDVIKLEASTSKAGNNLVYGQGGADSIDLSASEGLNTVYGGADKDTILGGSGDDYLSGDAGDDQLYGGIGNNTLVGGAGNDTFYYQGGNDIIDYVTGQDKIVLATAGYTVESSTVNDSDVILNISSGSSSVGTITLQNAKDKSVAVYNKDGALIVNRVFGYFDYGTATVNGTGTSYKGISLNSDFAETTLKATIYPTDTRVIHADSVKAEVYIQGNALNNTIIGSDYDDTLDGGAGNDSLLGGNGSNLLLGGVGDDTLAGGTVENTLTGGNGNDVFIHTGGNTYITDYEVGKDKIVLSGTSVVSAEVDGSDVVLTLEEDKGTVTISNAKDKTITIEEDGPNNATIKTEGIFGYFTYERDSNSPNAINSITLNADYTGPLATTTYASTVTTIDVSQVDSAIVINGNAKDNVITGSKNNDSETIYGWAGNDSIVGVSGADVFYGGDGTDILEGNGGSDSLYGDAGNDTITGGADDDFIYGGAGNDSLLGENGSDYIDGGEGADYIEGGAGNDSLLGGAGRDTLIADSGDNYFDGGADNDSMIGGTGSDTFKGGDGADTIVHVGGEDWITDYKYKDSDVIMLSDGDEVASSTVDGNNVILNVENGGTSKGSIVVVGGKDATLKVADSNGNAETRIFGYYNYDEDNNSITLNAGFEGTLASTLYPSSVVTIDASAVQSATNLTIYGNNQANYINGSDEADLLYGDAGADTILGNIGDDTISGGAGADSLDGGDGADSLSGGDADDTLIGGKDNDTLTGGNGTDVFVFSEGEDVITDYEENKDIIRYDEASAVSLASSAIDGKNVILTFQNGGTVTVLNGKDKKIKLGNLSASDITGKIYGYYDEDPNDSNSVTISSTFTEREFNAKTYNTNINNIDGSLLEDGITITIRGTDMSSTITGSNNADTIVGGKLNDLLDGGSGDDVLYGGADNDTLIGGDDNDVLYGEAGDDVLVGGTGVNTITGGAGADTLLYVEGEDIMTDYEANKDVIQLSTTKLVTSSLNDNDVILELGTGGFITLKGAKDKVVTLADSEGSVSGFFGYYDGVGQATISVNSAFAGTEINEKMYKGSTAVEVIDATQLVDKGIIIRGNSSSQTTILGGSNNDTIIGGSQADSLMGNDGDDVISVTGGSGNYADGGDGNDSLYGGTGADTLHGGDGYNVLTGGTGADAFLFTGGNDTITDYKVGEDVIAFTDTNLVVSSSAVNGDDVILTVGEKGTITVKNTRGKVITVDNAGTQESRVFGYFDVETINGSVSITLTPEFPDKEIKEAVYGDAVTSINGSQVGNGIAFYANSSVEGTFIIGTNYNDQIFGATSKNDTLNGGDGRDTLTGNSASTGNVFVHSRGEDIITDYTFRDSGRQDTIFLTDSAILDATISGKDVLITTTGDGVITIKNAKDQLIRIADSSTDISSIANVNARIYGYYNYGKLADGSDDTNTVVINSNFKEKKFVAADLASDAATIDASEVDKGIVIESGHTSKSVYIIGSVNSDKLIAGTNGDTLQGGDGVDTLVGGTGSDVFVHVAGNDVIDGYESDNDIILLSESSLASSTVNGKNVILTTTSGKTITVKNGKDVQLTVVDATGSDLTTETRVFGYYNYDSETQTITLNQTFSESNGLSEAQYNTEVQVIDASKVSKGVKVTAGSTAAMTVTGSAYGDKLYAGNGQSAYIDGGKGNDVITGNSSDDTLIGGEGADTLEGKAGNDTFIYVGGTDIIKDYSYGNDQSDVIVISDGTVTSSTVRGKDVVLTIGKNQTITVKNAKDATLSVVDNNGTDTRVFGYYSYGETTETIVLNSDFVDKALTTDQYVSEITTIDGSSLVKGITFNGNDKDNVIIGGKYADKIAGGEGNDSISAGDGNDSISGGNGDDTMIGGAGNDTFVGGSGTDRFVYVGGSDVITDYTNGDNDVIKLSTGKVGTSSHKGTDVVLNVVDINNAKKSIGTITLKGQKNQEITVIDANDVTDTRLFGYYSYGDTTDTIILNSDFGGTLYSTTTDGSAYYSTSVTVVDASKVGKATNIQGNGANTITGGTGNDTLNAGSGNSYLIGGNGNDSLIGGEGADTLVGGNGNDTMYGGGGSNTFVFTAGSEVIADYSVGEGNTISLASGKVTASTVKNSTDVVLTVGNKGTLTVKNANATELTVIDNTGASETRLFGYYSYASATKTITLNSDFKGTLASATGEGTAFYAADIVNIDASQVNNAITIQGNGIANKITAAKKSTTIVAGTGANTIIGGVAADSIVGGEGSDSIAAGAGNDIVDGGEGADILDGGQGNDSLNGGAGNDTIYAGLGNDTLTGGDGNDIFVYSGGVDTITDYVVGNDTISISGGSVTASTIKNNKDVVLTVGSKGTITVTDGKNKQLTVASNSGTVTGIFGYYSGVGTASIKLNADFTGTLYAEASDDNAYYESNVATIDGSQVKNSITINGNSNANRITADKRNTTIDGGAGNDTLIGGAGADSLFGGEGADILTGGAGNDTLWGGAGNDTLTGGAGRDVFMYSGGSDVISDYVAGQDTIRAEGATVSRSALSGSDIVFTMSTGNTLTVKNGNGKQITIVDGNGSSTKKYPESNGNLAVSGNNGSYSVVDDFWFTEDDDNFTTTNSGAQLDDISSLSDSNYSVGNIESVNYADITKDSKNAADKLVSSAK